VTATHLVAKKKTAIFPQCKPLSTSTAISAVGVCTLQPLQQNVILFLYPILAQYNLWCYLRVEK